MRGLMLIVFAAIVVYVSADLQVVCPKPIYGQVSIAPHPCKCNVYYECRDGQKIPKTCPLPFVFNAELQICDWPQKTKCKIDPQCFKTCQCTCSY